MAHQIGEAKEFERIAALELLFQQAEPTDAHRIISEIAALLREPERCDVALLVARGVGGVIGAIMVQALPGAVGLVWPPNVVALCPEPDLVLADLIYHGRHWLNRHGVRALQAIVPTEQSHWADPLLEHGFRRITRLLTLTHSLRVISAPAQALRYVPFDAAHQAEFLQSLSASYQQALDFPEFKGLLTPEERLAGHRDSSAVENWWLAYHGSAPIGVLMLSFQSNEGELAYVGVAEQHRGRGFGRELVIQALREACRRGLGQLVLSVDERNHPARRVYDDAGFSTISARDVYLG